MPSSCHEEFSVPSKTQEKRSSLPIFQFSVPAVISQVSSVGHVLSFALQDELKRHTVLHQTFITVLTVNGVKRSWDSVSECLMPGLKVKVDLVEDDNTASVDKWSVFGLHICTNNNSLSSPLALHNSTRDRQPLEVVTKDNEKASNSILDSSASSIDEVQLNTTFDVLESSLEKHKVCENKYEAGVVVVTVSDQYLRLLVQCGDTWLTTDVDPLTSMVLVNGVRIKEVLNIKMGTIGHMVTEDCSCSYCVFSPSPSNVSSLLVWFGETQVPSARGEPGSVVGKEDDRIVVQLHHSQDLVLFYGEKIKEEVLLNMKVLVWAWKKMVGSVGFSEGAAFVVISNHEEEYEGAKEALDLLELSSDIFSPIKSRSIEESFMYDGIDESFSVSFGSVSARDEDEIDNISIMESIENATETNNLQSKPTSMYEDLDEIYFQSLFWRLNSSNIDHSDSQFQSLVVSNNITNDNELVRDFENITRSSALPEVDASTIQYSALSSSETCSESCPILTPSLSVEGKFETLRLSQPTPLSPIPEESFDREISVLDIAEVDLVVSSQHHTSSTPTQSRRSYGKILGSPYPQSPDSCSPLSTMDSGYSDTISGVMETESVAVLEHFLDFTDFPENSRSDVISRFLAYRNTLKT